MVDHLDDVEEVRFELGRRHVDDIIIEDAKAATISQVLLIYDT
jgi:hypothetical protein